MSAIVVTAFSASLRNARTLEGALELAKDVNKLKDFDALKDYLTRQGNLHLEAFISAGRGKDIPYDQMYKKIKAMRGKQGLSNSEICAAAALWGAAQIKDVTIRLAPLIHYFPENGSIQDTEELRKIILETDGILLATPVYFGDRSSLTQKLLDFIRGDAELLASMRDKVGGGVTVGAKRNGGQETCLIYQLHDMMQLGCVGVGNDFTTTSQYGGTGHAGDIGTMAKDELGLNTSMGTGKRIASVASMLAMKKTHRLKSPLKVGMFILQERGQELRDKLQPFIDALGDNVDLQVYQVFQDEILPCMACDICPSRIGPDIEYRCMRGKSDNMHNIHRHLIESDVIIPAMLSPRDRSGLVTVYQSFLERLRYMRRGDYALSNRLIVPLVVGEIGSNENLNMRMITSLIRHHSVMHNPVIGWFKNGELLNPEDLQRGFESMVKQGSALTVGRLAGAVKGEIVVYKPVGFVLSACKDAADNALDKRQVAINERLSKLKEDYASRIEALDRQ